MFTADVVATVHFALKSVDALTRRLGAGGEAVSVGALLQELRAAGDGSKDRVARVRRLRGEVKELLDEVEGRAADLDEREELAAATIPRELTVAADRAIAGLDACRADVDAALGSAGEVSARLRIGGGHGGQSMAKEPRERSAADVDALVLRAEGVLAAMREHATALLDVLAHVDGILEAT